MNQLLKFRHSQLMEIQKPSILDNHHFLMAPFSLAAAVSNSFVGVWKSLEELWGDPKLLDKLLNFDKDNIPADVPCFWVRFEGVSLQKNVLALLN